MNCRHLLALTISSTLFLAVPSLVCAQQSGGLGPQMHAMGQDYKTLSGQINDAGKNDASLKLIDDMEQHTLAAKGMTPPIVAKAGEADRPKMLAKFRSEMGKLLQQEVDLEQALLDNDNAKAADMLGKMHQTEGEGHKEFRRRG